MNFNLKKVIKNELLPNEDILWRGAPCLLKNFTKGDIFFIPFSALWGVFVIFWLIGTISIGGIFGFFFGMPLTVIGLYLIFGRFIVKKSMKKI